MPCGEAGRRTTSRRRPVASSSRRSVRSSWLATHTEAPSSDSASGSLTRPSGLRSSRPVRGSMRQIRLREPSAGSLTHTPDGVTRTRLPLLRAGTAIRAVTVPPAGSTRTTSMTG